MARRGLRRLPPFKDYLFRAAVLLSISFVALTFVIVTYRPPTPNHGQSEQAKSDQENIQSKSFGEKLFDDPTAFFTMVLAGLTFVLAGVSSIQIYFLLSADRTTRLSARAAIKSAEVAARTVRSIENTAARQLRAYVGTIGTGFNGPWNNLPFSVTVTIKNFGQTPAIDFDTAVYLRVLTNPLQGMFPPDDFHFSFRNQSLMPGKETIVVCELEIKDALVSAIILDGISKETMALYVVGRIVYADVFGGVNYTNIRMLAKGKRIGTNAPFIDAPEGNETT